MILQNDSMSDSHGEAPAGAGGPSQAELRQAGIVALVLLALLNVGDVALTQLLLTRGGVELNPVADRLLASDIALAVKLALVAALAVHFMRRGPRLIVVCFMWLVAGIYLLVVVVNCSQLVSIWGH